MTALTPSLRLVFLALLLCGVGLNSADGDRDSAFIGYSEKKPGEPALAPLPHFYRHWPAVWHPAQPVWRPTSRHPALQATAGTRTPAARSAPGPASACVTPP
jgi:hypothetical protein